MSFLSSFVKPLLFSRMWVWNGGLSVIHSMICAWAPKETRLAIPMAATDGYLFLWGVPTVGRARAKFENLPSP